MASILTGLDALKIGPQQATLLAEPAYEVCEKYGLSADYFMGPEISLFVAAALVYGPMMTLLKAEIEAKRRAATARPAGGHSEAGTVVDLATRRGPPPGAAHHHPAGPFGPGPIIDQPIAVDEHTGLPVDGLSGTIEPAAEGGVVGIAE